MPAWLASAKPDIVAMQETRAPADVVRSAVGAGWLIDVAESDTKGRAGVAVASRHAAVSSTAGLDGEGFRGDGRWIESTFATSDGRSLVVVSSYVHTGDETDPDRMAEKLAFMDAAVARVAQLAAEGHHVVWTGDLNVAHREADIKNWKGNRGKAGFLPEEREHLDRVIDEHGFVDLGRRFGGDGPGPFSWWSYRGRAFDTDAGWRIDYQLASASLAELASSCEVHKAPAYDQRWSDHAPVVAEFAIDLTPGS